MGFSRMRRKWFKICLGFDYNYLCTYDLYSPVLDACISIIRASGRGLGPGIREFSGPCEMASSWKASAIWGPKNSRIPGPNPIPLALLMDMHASKTLCTGLYKSLVHRWFYEHENPLMGLRGPDGEGGKVGSRRGRSEGAELEGENKRGGGA